MVPHRTRPSSTHIVETERLESVARTQELEEVMCPKVIADIAEYSDPHIGLVCSPGFGSGLKSRLSEGVIIPEPDMLKYYRWRLTHRHRVQARVR